MTYFYAWRGSQNGPALLCSTGRCGWGRVRMLFAWCEL